jgi:hypothetical protein
MVFEYLDKDLKKFMDDFDPVPGCPGLPEKMAKVRAQGSAKLKYGTIILFKKQEQAFALWLSLAG